MAEAAHDIRSDAGRGRPQIGRLGEGRLHLQEGPIDLVIEAFGAPQAVARAYRAAAARFDGLLAGLCRELPLLRQQVLPGPCHLEDPIARHMHAAVAPFAEASFITPMAAVAGAVAEAILAAMIEAAPLARAYVNNGGDIALHLAPGETFDIGLVDRPDRPSLFAKARIAASDGIRGIATSGCRGRSFSLGIADAVTVLAGRAADADAAATIIANAIDLPGHPGIRRCPASALQPDSDLGAMPVTRDVAPLSAGKRAIALEAGAAAARQFAKAGLIRAAALHLQGETRIVGEANATPRALSDDVASRFIEENATKQRSKAVVRFR
jgi:ApbE superfamily uncharacterized protein (UPF0280 family)